MYIYIYKYISFFSTCLYSEDYYVNTWACLVGCRNIETKNDPYHWFETKFYKSEQKLCCQNVSNKLNIKNPTRLFLIQPPSSFPIPSLPLHSSLSRILGPKAIESFSLSLSRAFFVLCCCESSWF